MQSPKSLKLVLLTSSQTSGGAAIACMRQARTLRQAGHQVTVLSPETWWPDGFLGRWMQRGYTLRKHLVYKIQQYLVWTPGAMFSGNPWPAGDPSRMQHPALKEADAVVLHWINHGFLGSSDLRGLLDLGKPVLWHMHDQWAFTGGCHYSGACTAFEMACGSCPQLRRSGPGDRSRRQFMERQQWAAQAGDRLALVAPSEWLAGLAAKSSIVRGSGAWVRCIPNPFDPAVDGQGLQPRLVTSGHSRPRLFFAAVNPSDSRKGWDLLMMALEHLGREGMVCDVEVAGKVTEPARSRVQALEAGGHQVTWLGLLGPKAMQEAYARADLFVIPSLQENFPNTVLESFAVGTPVVGFAAGGIASMIVEGQNGALAPAVDPWASEASKAMAAFNLASAMLRVVQHPQGNLLRRGAHQSLEQVRPERVAKDYTDLIHDMLQNSSKDL